jgi:hypothetical protein
MNIKRLKNEGEIFMLKINKEEIENRKAEAKAKRMFSKMMTDMLLESDAPEHVKMSVRVLNKVQDVHNAIEELIVLKYTVPGNEANTETLKKVLEYLELVEVGINQFVETTPFVAHTEEE